MHRVSEYHGVTLHSVQRSSREADSLRKLVFCIFEEIKTVVRLVRLLTTWITKPPSDDFKLYKPYNTRKLRKPPLSRNARHLRADGSEQPFTLCGCDGSKQARRGNAGIPCPMMAQTFQARLHDSFTAFAQLAPAYRHPKNVAISRCTAARIGADGSAQPAAGR